MINQESGPGLNPATTPKIASLPGRPASLTDQVVDAIRRAAHTGELQPGELYSAYQIADLLGVSRGPVREALMKLSEAGMVRMERNRGFRIIVPDAREIAEIFHLRLLLEVPAARAAAQRSATQSQTLDDDFRNMSRAARAQDADRFMLYDRDFHEAILRTTRNRRLVASVNALRDATRTLGASTVDQSRSLADIADEHAPILNAIRAGDPAAAAEAMAGHIVHTGKLLVMQALRADGEGPEKVDRLWNEIVGDEG